MPTNESEQIRLATETDLAAIDRIYNQAVATGFRTAHIRPLTDNQRKIWFQNHDPDNYPVFVFTRKQEVLGWASFSAYRPGREALEEVAELSFYVDFLHHGEGIGSEMIEHCLAQSLELHKRVVFCIIIEGNAGSIRLLQKYGFDRWGYLPEAIHVNDQKRGHVYMGKIISE
ncbi:MAG TPA: GNAT family N-acetyltransferase [Balneolales bacterium]|nr:GNAT family N-acetyltransferase [Balneolales bacterium]